MSNWKEELWRKFANTDVHSATIRSTEDFISTEIIEKLIAEMEILANDDIDGRQIEKVAEHFGVPVSVAANRRLDLFVEELKAKWLGKESNV